jgi:uncharacterized protein YggE
MQMETFENRRKPLFPLILLIIIAGVLISQKFGFSWGSLQLSSPATITVSGYADGSQLNQKAHFRATVTAENEDKDAATRELTENTNKLIDQIKNFGVEPKNIKTENLRVYEFEDYVYTDGVAEIDLMYPPRQPQKMVKKWRATNTLSVTIEDASDASSFSDLLINSVATNVSGPSFEAGDTAELEKELLEKAMENAEEKAATILKNSKQKVVKIIQVSEGGRSVYPVYKSLPMAGGGIAMDAMESIEVEPGSQELTKSVTVIFEIR